MTQARFNAVAAVSSSGGMREWPWGGTIIWLATIAALLFISEDWELRWAGGLFLFAPLVLVPMAFPFTRPTRSPGVASRLWKWIERLLLPSAAILAISFLLPVSKIAGLLAIPWLMMTGLIALVGLIDFREAAHPRFAHYCRWIGMLYLPVGGAWAVLSRWGFNPLGFSDIIVLATAVHFHYAGFLLPVLTSQIIERRPSIVIRAGAALALAAVPALATGITLTRYGYQGPEFVAAMFFAAAAITITLCQIHLAWTQFEGAPRALLIFSAASLIVGMVMASLFATGGWLGAHLWGIDIPWMLRWHAVINAFGYTLCGLWAWRMIVKSFTSENE